MGRMRTPGSDIGSLIDLALDGRGAEWTGDHGVASAITAIMSDEAVAAVYQRGGEAADFVLACTCAWVASEICTTLPDPGRPLPSIAVPDGAKAEALSSRAQAVHADEGAGPHARSLAGMFLTYLRYDGSMKWAHEQVSPFRRLIHERCPDVPIRPLPRRLNDVSRWAYHVFHTDRGCRRRVLQRALDENGAGARTGRFDDRFSALAHVGWEFGYGDAWSTPESARVMANVVANAVFEGGRELYRRVSSQDVDLAWRGPAPRRLGASPRESALHQAVGQAGLAKLRLPPPWGEVLAYNSVGILAGLGISLVKAAGPGRTAVGEPLRARALTEVAKRPVPIARTSRGRTHQGHFLKHVHRSVPLLLGVSAVVTALMAVGLPGWTASWISTIAVTLLLARARRKSLFTGVLGWPRAAALGGVLTVLMLSPPVVAAWLQGAAWTPATAALFAAGAAVSAAVAALVVASPYVTYKIGPAAWMLQRWGVPDDVADAFDDAVASQLSGRRR